MKIKTKELSFAEKYIAFKSGEGSAPILHKTSDIKINKETKQVVITMQMEDSDGEVVLVEGGRIRDPNGNIPMIDSHNSWSSVTQNGLGAFRNVRKDMVDGRQVWVGEADFAPTPNGKIAEVLYMGVDGGKPYFSDVSMGFMVYDYDNETATIKEWEVFECSLVTAGANRGARFIEGKSLEQEVSGKTKAEEDLQIAKDLARFKQIGEPFKEFTKLFLSDAFCKMIDYTKDGNLLLDINAIYDRINTRFAVEQEAPTSTEEAPEESKQKKNPVIATKEVVLKALIEAIAKDISS